MEIIIEKYRLSFSGKTQSQISFSLECTSPTCNATKEEFRKVYIIKLGDKFLYIGEAKCSIKTRLNRGFVSYRHYIKNGFARSGYQGYKWIKKSDCSEPPILDVFVIVFEEKYNNLRGFVEAVEGELVFLIRKETKQWPEYQNEIHFNNEEGSQKIAEEIFEMLQVFRLNSIPA